MKKPAEQEDRQLDEMLEQLARQQHKAPGYLAQRIMANLPAAGTAETGPAADVFGWLFGSVWRSAWAAAVPVLLGFVIGLNFSDNYGGLDVEALVFVEQEEVFNVDEI